jgi:MFS superfamily sulfate permease-like transporter
LPQFDPPDAAWERIRQAIPERDSALRLPKLRLAAAAVVALAVITLLAAHFDRRSGATSELANVDASLPQVIPHVDELVAQSQQLEQILRKLPERPRIERVATAAAIDTMEQRIQWLDFQLSNAPEADLSDEQSRQLWRERVELMDSLVKVRYAEAGALWF